MQINNVINSTKLFCNNQSICQFLWTKFWGTICPSSALVCSLDPTKHISRILFEILSNAHAITLDKGLIIRTICGLKNSPKIIGLMSFTSGQTSSQMFGMKSPQPAQMFVWDLLPLVWNLSQKDDYCVPTILYQMLLSHHPLYIVSQFLISTILYQENCCASPDCDRRGSGDQYQLCPLHPGDLWPLTFDQYQILSPSSRWLPLITN